MTMKATTWFYGTSFHQSRETTRAPEPARHHVDTRPRVKYVFPDGRLALVIVDHGETPNPMISMSVSQNDPLWETAQRVTGSTSTRVVWLTLAQGM